MARIENEVVIDGDVAYVRVRQQNGSVHTIILDYMAYCFIEAARLHLCVSRTKSGLYYARTRLNEGDNRLYHLHRILMYPMHRNKKHVVIDHINGQSLDCRHNNMRATSYSENNRNRRPRKPKEANQ